MPQVNPFKILSLLPSLGKKLIQLVGLLISRDSLGVMQGSEAPSVITSLVSLILAVSLILSGRHLAGHLLFQQILLKIFQPLLCRLWRMSGP